MLQERTPEQNISHRRMPKWDEHTAHVDRHIAGEVIYDDDGEISFVPHKHWYLVETAPGGIIGQVYLTWLNEIGIQIYRGNHRRGYGRRSIEALVEVAGPGEYIANINPKNAASIKLFQSLQFDLIQYTYRGKLGG
jgi:RimJ/RimL family protein N-acetyltransferase